MGLDSDVAIRWFIDRANADVTLTTLLNPAGGSAVKVFRGGDAPRGTNPPYVLVTGVATQPPMRFVLDGPNTQVSTMCRIQTTIIDRDNTAYFANEKLADVASRLIDLLDGQVYQTTSDGLINTCMTIQDRDREQYAGDVLYRYKDIDWYIDAKAN